MKDDSGLEIDRDQLTPEELLDAGADPVIAADTGSGSPEGESDPAAGEGEVNSELESMKDRYLRLAAEFDNYRRRVERERVEYRTRAQADLVLPLLDLLDDLERVAGLDAGATTVDALLEGVQLIEKKFRRALESEGLEPIAAEGEFFNPSTMEALMTVEAEHPEEDDQVADVFQNGYHFKDLLIRPARVRVKKYDS